MSVDISSFTLQEALSIAIQAEKRSESVYEKLLNAVQNFVMRDKLTFLINEEKKHQRILESMYAKLFPKKDLLKRELSLVPELNIDVDNETQVTDLLEMAMQSEKAFEEFYDLLSQEVEERKVAHLLAYLSSMEHGHYFLIKGEYDLCVEDETYYERDTFDYDMVHIGP